MTTLVRAATLAAFGSLLVLSGLAIRTASAHEPHPGLQFSIGVRGVPGCNTRASDVSCTLPAGQPFVLEVGLDALPDDIPSYGGFDLYAEYGGVTAQEDGSTDVWPDCGFPATHYGDGTIALACARGVPPAGPSSYVGPIGTNTFTCSQSGSISLVHSAENGYTDLIQDVVPSATPEESVTLSHAEGTGTNETLTITCGQLPANTPGVVTAGTPGPAGPTPHVEHPDITGPGNETPTGGTPGATLEPTAAAKATATAKVKTTATAKSPGGTKPGNSGSSSSKTWVWIVIVVAGVAAVVIAGGGYWYVRSRSGTPPSDGSAT